MEIFAAWAPKWICIICGGWRSHKQTPVLCVCVCVGERKRESGADEAYLLGQTNCEWITTQPEWTRMWWKWEWRDGGSWKQQYMHKISHIWFWCIRIHVFELYATRHTRLRSENSLRWISMWQSFEDPLEHETYPCKIATEHFHRVRLALPAYSASFGRATLPWSFWCYEIKYD